MLTSAQGPIDLVITDPDGFTITPTTIIPSELEFLREIPGELYYSEMEKGLDGNPIVHVYAYKAKIGDYTIQVIPNAAKASNRFASQTSAYWLDFSVGEQSLTLASSTLVSQIPPQGYSVRVARDGSISLLMEFKSTELGSHGLIWPSSRMTCDFGGSFCIYEAIDESGVLHHTLQKIYRTDFDGSTKLLAGPGVGNPKLSPNRQLIAYEDYGAETMTLKTNVWVMNADGAQKRPLTKDSNSTIEKWISDKELLVWEAEFSATGLEDWWIGKRLRKIDVESNTEEEYFVKKEDVVERTQIKIDYDLDSYIPKEFRVLYNGKTIYAFPYHNIYIGIAGEGRSGKPAVIEVSGNKVMTIIPAKPKESETTFKLVVIDAQNGASQTVYEGISPTTWLSLSFDAQILLFLDKEHDLWALNTTNGKIVKANITPSTNTSSITVAGKLYQQCMNGAHAPIWSPQSDSIILVVQHYCRENAVYTAYKIDLPGEIK